jgi:LL-diaminopimelate aminotransferase
MKLAHRMTRIPPYLFAGLEAKAAELRSKGVDLVDLGIADPDLPPPAWMVQAVKDHLNDPGAHNYPTSAGDPDVRSAIAAWMEGRFGVQLDPGKEIAVVIGGKEGLANLSRAFVNPGDIVAAPDPGYPVYANGAAILNDGEARFLPLRPENGFLPDLNEAEGAAILFLNYPNNPTGAVAPESFYRNVAKFADDHPETLVVWDAAYVELAFGGERPPSLLQFTKNAIEIHSLSKMMNVTGYRIGFAAGHEEAVAALVKVKSQLDSGAPVFIQRAMADALSRYEGIEPPAEAAANHEEYGRRKKMIETGLSGVPGVETVYESTATFFTWMKVADDVAFVEKAMEAGVILTPGRGFGASGEGFVRAAVTQPGERIELAVERLKKL